MDPKKLKVNFPMIDMSSFHRPSSWTDFSAQIMSQRFAQFVQSNHKDDHYISFLNNAAFKIPTVTKKLQPKTPFGQLLKNHEDAVHEEGSRSITRESDDHRRVSKMFMSMSKLLHFSESRVKRNKQYNIVWNQIGKKTERSKSAIAQMKPKLAATVEDAGVLTEPKRSELFLFRNLSLSCLMNIVLRTLIAHFEIDCELKTRRKSSELRIDGGRISKQDLSLHLPDMLSSIREFFLKLQLTKDEAKKPSAPPWFLDNNPHSLNGSLEGLKSIILKFACSSENVLYNVQEVLALNKKNLAAPVEEEETNSNLPKSDKASERKSKKTSMQKDIVDQFGVEEEVLNMGKVKDIILISIDLKTPQQSKPAASSPQLPASNTSLSLKIPVEAAFRSKSPTNDQTANLNMRELMNAKSRLSYNINSCPVKVTAPHNFESAGDIPELVLGKSR